MMRSLTASDFLTVSALCRTDAIVDPRTSNPFWYSSQSGIMEGAEPKSAVKVSYFAAYSLYMKNRFIWQARSAKQKLELFMQAYPLGKYPGNICCNLRVGEEPGRSIGRRRAMVILGNCVEAAPATMAGQFSLVLIFQWRDEQLCLRL